MTPATCKVCGVALTVTRSIAGVDAYLIAAPKAHDDKRGGVVVIRRGFAEIVHKAEKGEARYLYHTHGSAS